MLSRHNKAKMAPEEMIGLLIGIAIVALLFYFLIYAFTFDYNPVSETVLSYHDSLLQSFSEADEYGSGTYTPIPDSDKEQYYFLVYFGDSNLYPSYSYYVEGRTSYLTNFILRRDTSNTICICDLYRDSSVESRVVDTKEETGPDGETFTETYEVEYFAKDSDSSCRKCTDLDYPLEVRGRSPPVYSLYDYYFEIQKVRDSEGQTKYVMEVLKR